MDRLIALVAVRWRLDVRSLAGRRSQVVSLLLAVPALVLFSLATAFVAHFLARLLERGQPALVLPLLSALAGAFGLVWALSPLLAGLAATETHDLGRLMQYPVPVPTLLASSLLANVLQPVVLAQLPPLAALSLGLAGPRPRAAVVFAALLLSLALALAAGQAVGLALHALSRHRRWHDRAQAAGIVLGLAASLLPLLLLSSAGSSARTTLRVLLESDVFALLPFSWGARAAVHASRGAPLAFLGWAAAAVLAIVGALGVSTVLAQRLYRGETDLGEAGTSRFGRARMRLPGAVGALLEKDLLMTWRDPRLKVLLFSGLIGPVLVLVAVWQGTAGRVPAALMLSLASLAGLGALGANVFGIERQAIALLFAFPVERFSILLAKNLATMTLRLPALALLAVATLVVAGPALLPAVVTLALLTQIVASAIDNFVSIVAPLPLPAAGRDPSTTSSGVRGLGAAAIGFAAMLAALVVSAPFAFLAWLPHLLGRRLLWAFALPLALAGAAAVYFMLTSLAARLVERREPDLIARASGES